jgi:hypothetical protein
VHRLLRSSSSTASAATTRGPVASSICAWIAAASRWTTWRDSSRKRAVLVARPSWKVILDSFAAKGLIELPPGIDD